MVDDQAAAAKKRAPRGRPIALKQIAGDDVSAVLQPAAQHLPKTGISGPRVIDVEHIAVNLATPDDYVHEVGRLWESASRTFVQIGRHISEAKSRFAHGEFMDEIQKRLPFSIDIAERLMAIADAVDKGVYPETVLPPNWSVAHALVTLKDDERPKAVEEGLVRPSVTRREIAEFKKRMRGDAGSLDERAAARKELAKLLNRMERDRKRLAELRTLIGDEG